MEEAIVVDNKLINTDYIVHITERRARKTGDANAKTKRCYFIALAFHPPGEEVMVVEGEPGFEQVETYFKWRSQLALGTSEVRAQIVAGTYRDDIPF